MLDTTFYRLYIELREGGASFCEQTRYHSTEEGAIKELYENAPGLKTVLRDFYDEQEVENPYEEWLLGVFLKGGDWIWLEATVEWTEIVPVID